mgnify:CR=1 FL=1
MKAPGTAYDNALIGRDPQPAHMRDYKQLPDTRSGDWGGPPGGGGRKQRR